MIDTLEETAAESAGMLGPGGDASSRHPWALLWGPRYRGLLARETGTMNRIDVGWWYRLAMTLIPLKALSLDERGDWLRLLAYADGMLTQLLSKSFYPIRASWPACHELRERMRQLTGTGEGAGSGSIEAVGWAAARLENVLLEEVGTLDVYIPSDKGAYSSTILAEEGHKALGDEALGVVSEDTARDFDEAGRCLAFGLATAAGYHVMRATESVIRQWYALAVDTPKARILWDDAVVELEKVAAEEDKATLELLGHLRRHLRNRLMHPEDFLNTDQAMDAFATAQVMIRAMAKRISEQPRYVPRPSPIEPEPPSGQSLGDAQD